MVIKCLHWWLDYEKKLSTYSTKPKITPNIFCGCKDFTPDATILLSTKPFYVKLTSSRKLNLSKKTTRSNNLLTKVLR